MAFKSCFNNFQKFTFTCITIARVVTCASWLCTSTVLFHMDTGIIFISFRYNLATKSLIIRHVATNAAKVFYLVFASDNTNRELRLTWWILRGDYVAPGHLYLLSHIYPEKNVFFFKFWNACDALAYELHISYLICCCHCSLSLLIAMCLSLGLCQSINQSVNYRQSWTIKTKKKNYLTYYLISSY